jgi:hypothetical protein
MESIRVPNEAIRRHDAPLFVSMQHQGSCWHAEGHTYDRQTGHFDGSTRLLKAAFSERIWELHTIIEAPVCPLRSLQM